jgi:hypothetical protein
LYHIRADIGGPLDLCKGPATLGSGLAGRQRRAALDELHDAVLRRGGDHIGNIAPRAIEQPGRNIVFLAERADFAAVLAAHPPDDLDVLLAGFWLGDDDIGVEDEIGRSLRVGDDRDILPLQDLGDGPRQRLPAISRRTLDTADQQPRLPAELSLARSFVLQQGGETRDRILGPLPPIASEPRSARCVRRATGLTAQYVRLSPRTLVQRPKPNRRRFASGRRTSPPRRVGD